MPCRCWSGEALLAAAMEDNRPEGVSLLSCAKRDSEEVWPSVIASCLSPVECCMPKAEEVGPLAMPALPRRAISWLMERPIFDPMETPPRESEEPPMREPEPRVLLLPPRGESWRSDTGRLLPVHPVHTAAGAPGTLPLWPATCVGNNATLARRLIQRKCRLKCPIDSTLCASGVLLETSEGKRA